MAVDTTLDWYGDKNKQDIEKAIIKFLVRGSNIVQADAKSLVAVDTGNLRGSIVKAVDSGGLTGSVFTNSEYAPSQEFGKRSQPNYTFNPFMRPALKNNEDLLLRIAEQEVSKVVD